jgi:hypothetical protein
MCAEYIIRLILFDSLTLTKLSESSGTQPHTTCNDILNKFHRWFKYYLEDLICGVDFNLLLWCINISQR